MIVGLLGEAPCPMYTLPKYTVWARIEGNSPDVCKHLREVPSSSLAESAVI